MWSYWINASKEMKLKPSHNKFEIVLNTVYITSFVYIFGIVIHTIVMNF